MALSWNDRGTVPADSAFVFRLAQRVTFPQQWDYRFNIEERAFAALLQSTDLDALARRRDRRLRRFESVLDVAIAAAYGTPDDAPVNRNAHLFLHRSCTACSIASIA